jgi:hypothetical protein
MADILNIIIWLFAAVGLVTLTVIALYYIAKALKKYKPSDTPIWPDEDYMEKLGVICPTGWVYRGTNRSGKNICQNYYRVPIADEDNCYDDKSNKLSYFDKINDWQKCQDDVGNCRPLRNRCKWIKKCGPLSNIIDPTKCNAQGNWVNDNEVDGKDQISNPYASWIGVSDKC